MKVLIVEDSERLRRSLEVGLRKSGFVVDVSLCSRMEWWTRISGLEFALAGGYDAIVLDLMLPGRSGFELLANLRGAGSDVCVLILSARDQVEDRVLGLDRGADDYLVKPFAFEELVARLRSLSRRRHRNVKPTIHLGEVTIDLARNEALRDGRSLELTASELRLLEALALRRGRIVSKRDLVDLLHDADASVTENAIEVLISGLRRKLGADASAALRTRRGLGYVLD